MNTYDRWVQMMQMKHARAKWILGRLGSASMDLDSVNPYVFWTPKRDVWNLL